MDIQRLILAQKQLAEELVNKTDTSLLSDETFKFEKKPGFHLNDKDGKTRVLGLKATKSGSDTLLTLQNILEDINKTSKSCENSVSKHILLSIVSTIRVEQPCRKKFNELLADYRKMVLMEDLRNNWQNMTEEEQLSLSKLAISFCGLHSLVHIAEAASKSISQVEKSYLKLPCQVLIRGLTMEQNQLP
jgi:hypothetical protein